MSMGQLHFGGMFIKQCQLERFIQDFRQRSVDADELLGLRKAADGLGRFSGVGGASGLVSG